MRVECRDYANQVVSQVPVKSTNIQSGSSISFKKDSIGVKEKGWFKKWLDNKDKISIDGKDDGKISGKEKLESFGKGLLGIVKTVVKHPIATAISVVGGLVLTTVTCGAALPALVAVGVTVGAAQIGYGAYKAITAKTDGEAKQAWESMGNGTFAVATSALGAKGALNAANKAGVTSAAGADKFNIIQSTAQCFKSTPESIAVSGSYIKSNFLSLIGSNSTVASVTTGTNGVIGKGSNELDDAVPYMSKANEAQAYRFNPNGTEADILKNNPGVFKGTDGKYYVNNKWDALKPFEINPSKEQMIMMYGPDDMAVCDGGVFNGSYVDTNGFKANAALNYQDPAKLNYGEVINVTKQAPGAYKIVPTGTKVQTLEGLRIVQEGEVIAIDHLGNPYVTPAANIIKRNIPVSVEGTKAFEQLQSLIKK